MSPEKVSHAVASPRSKPVLNQRVRCSAVPCVNVSGLIRPVACSWMRSSPTERGRGQPLLEVALLQQPALERRVRPHAGEAVGLQLGADGERVALVGVLARGVVDLLRDAR